MKFKLWFTVLAASISLLSGTAATASPLTTYQISIDTTALNGGFFQLDFQLNDGSATGDGNSMVTLTNFNFGGGAASGAPLLSVGASGDTINGASLSDVTFLNEILQDFIAGNTLSFTLGLALNDDPGTPDLFTLAIIDGTGFEIPTGGPLGSEIVSFQYGDNAPQAFASSGPFAIPLPTVTAVPGPNAVPEPSALLLILAGLAALGASRRLSGRPH